MIEPDTARCQAVVIIKRSPFIMGGKINETIRCDNKPTVVIKEKQPGDDGLIGSMSLCDKCLAVFLEEDNRPVDIAVIT